jgi:hypothetical protein
MLCRTMPRPGLASALMVHVNTQLEQLMTQIVARIHAGKRRQVPLSSSREFPLALLRLMLAPWLALARFGQLPSVSFP